MGFIIANNPMHSNSINGRCGRSLNPKERRERPHRAHAALRGILAFWALAFPRLHAQLSDAPSELYNFNALGLAGTGPNSYVDWHPGNDLLPYTDDDLRMPRRGNVEGTWSGAHIDLDRNGRIEPEEHIFTVSRAGEPDVFSFSAMSHPEYGVLFESRNSTRYHEARNAGPSRSFIGDALKEGNDFGTSDRPEAGTESNSFIYHNRADDQLRGGKPKYYIEHINPGSAAAAPEPFIFNGIEGYRQALNFEHHLDNPDTPFNETGDCRADYFRGYETVTRGYLIPVADLPSLENGQLPTLFGWESVDLAAYFRESIALALHDPALNVHNPLGNPSQVLPPTHVLLLQTRTPITIDAGGICAAGQAQALQMADTWDIPPTGAVFRTSKVLGFNASFTASHFGSEVRPWVDTPTDGVALNLWLLDHFFRDGTHLGLYEKRGAAWSIEVDPSGAGIDGTRARVLVADVSADSSSIRAPLPRGSKSVIVVLDVAQGPSPGGGPVVASPAPYQVILEGGGTVAAYAEISTAAVSVHRGGSLDLDTEGFVSGNGASASGPGLQPGDLSIGGTIRLVVAATREALQVYALPHGSFKPNVFTGLLDSLKLVVSLPAADDREIDAVRLSVREASARFGLATIAVFEPASPRFVRGDVDASGQVDLTDAVILLGHLFLSNPAPPCLDAADSADEGRLEITSAIYLLNWLFLGGPPPPPPTPLPGAPPGGSCGVDPTVDAGAGGDLGCLSFPPCAP